MADTMALESSQGVFQRSEATLVGNNEVVTQGVSDNNHQPPSLIKSSGVSEFLARPLVKRTIPAMIGLFCVLLFLTIYFSVTAVGSRALYPSMSEADRS